MKNLILTAFLAFALLLPPNVLARHRMPIQRFSVGADAGIQIPLGEFADSAGIGLSGTVQAEYILTPTLLLSARAGFIYHIEKHNVQFDQIPMLGGVKYSFDDSFPFYLTVEAGYFIVEKQLPNPGLLVYDASENFGMNQYNRFGGILGVGHPFGDFEVGMNLSFWDILHISQRMGIGITVGFNPPTL